MSYQRTVGRDQRWRRGHAEALREFGIAVWRRSLESFPREVGAKAQRGRDWASSPQRIPNCGGRGRRDPAGIWRTVAPTTPATPWPSPRSRLSRKRHRGHVLRVRLLGTGAQKRHGPAKPFGAEKGVLRTRREARSWEKRLTKSRRAASTSRWRRARESGSARPAGDGRRPVASSLPALGMPRHGAYRAESRSRGAGDNLGAINRMPWAI